MSNNHVTPSPQSGAGRVLTAFLAGAMLGAFAMVEMAPRDAINGQNAGVAMPGQPMTGQPGVPTDTGTTGDPDAVGTVEGGGGSQFVDANGNVVNLDDLTGGNGSTGTTGTTGTSDTSGTTGTTGTSDTSGTTGTTGTSDTSGTTGTTGTSDTSGTSGGEIDGTSGSGSDGFSFEGGSTDSSSNTNTESGGGSACAANNGGVTAPGVTATEIQVAATVVEDGPGASLLGPATTGMKAVIDKVNRSGGICGRRIALETKNDGWDAARGRDFIRRFIEAKKFSLLVVPSSEGLAEAIKGGLISNAQIPVVGTTGLRIDEYSEPWVFPVSTATISVMRIMAKHAYDGGARSFGIVWDNKFKFGLEGANAFKQLVGELPGATLKADVSLDPTNTSGYGTQANQFNQQCGNTSSAPGCDMVALLLVPDTALAWADKNPGDVNGRGKETHGSQTLFTDDFGSRCGSWCNGLIVWSGYNPPIPPVDDKAGVKQYVSDVKSVSPSIDFRNQFVEGAYLGAQVFVNAATACSPNLTRACIKQYLESTDQKTDLANVLSWRPGKHHANKFAQAFSISASGGGFNGWRYQQTGWVKDPKL